MSIRCVRNFYMNADVEGYQNMISGGPRNANGTMSITVTQRNDGCVDEAVTIKCYRTITVENEKEIVRLITSVRDKDGNEVYKYETER